MEKADETMKPVGETMEMAMNTAQKGIDIPSIIIEDIGPEDEQTSRDNDDDVTVTLRRKRQDGLGTIPEEKYMYEDMVETNHQSTSRKKNEIGSEKMISNDDVRLAATLVHDAMDGRTIDIKTEPKYVRSYNLYKSWPLTNLLYLALTVDLSLVLFEAPAVDSMSWPIWVTMTVEIICLTYFVFRTCHHAHWRRRAAFFHDRKNISVIAILVLTVLDMVVYLILTHTYPDKQHIRYSRALRAVLIVNFSDGRQIRRAWRNIRRTSKEIAHVIFLFYFFIFVFALIAYRMFRHRTDIVYPNGGAYFKEYFECVWDLYILVTTSNNPDVMMPAYDKSRFYCIFFFIYILVCFYMLLNVFLAVAYHSYSENMKREIKASSQAKKKKLGQAFDVIKINCKGEDMVTYRIWKRLMRLAKPNITKHQIDLLMLILDMNRSGYIGRREFMNVADLMNVRVSEVSDRITWLEIKFPAIYTSVPSEYLKAIVESIFFKFFYDLVVVINIFLIAFFIPDIDVPFCMLFLVEILLKLYTYGPRKYFRKILNWFDVSVTFISLVLIQVEGFTEDKAALPRDAIGVINILRIFRVLRLLVHIQRFKIITDTLVNISLSILIYGGIVFIISYVFAVIGMEVFQGRVHFFANATMATNGTNGTTQMPSNDTSTLYCGAPELAGSAFYESGYCNMNFNDFTSALLVLSALLFENNWHILSEGYVLVTNKAARLYFAVFNMCVTIVVMNIVTAFVVDMFMYEYTIQKKDNDSLVERKIKELGLGIDADTKLLMSSEQCGHSPSDLRLQCSHNANISAASAQRVNKECLGLEISAPMTDNQMRELLKGDGPTRGASSRQAWAGGPSFPGLKKAENRFSQISSYVLKRKSSIAPTLNKFDGIRFHIKKRGWTKIEVLLQQLYEGESDMDIDTTVNLSVEQTKVTNKTRSILL